MKYSYTVLLVASIINLSSSGSYTYVHRYKIQNLQQNTVEIITQQKWSAKSHKKAILSLNLTEYPIP